MSRSRARIDALAEVSNEATSAKDLPTDRGSVLSISFLGEGAIGTPSKMLIGGFDGGMAGIGVDTLAEVCTTLLVVVIIGLGSVTALSYAIGALAGAFFDTDVSNVVIVNASFDIIAPVVNRVKSAIGISADVDTSIWGAVLAVLELMELPASNK